MHLDDLAVGVHWQVCLVQKGIIGARRIQAAELRRPFWLCRGSQVGYNARRAMLGCPWCDVILTSVVLHRQVGREAKEYIAAIGIAQEGRDISKPGA